MAELEKVISDLEQQIRWIEEIECHKFPGWLNCTNAMRDALELLKEYKRQDGCPCTHCEEYECEKVCDEYREWYKNNKAI